MMASDSRDAWWAIVAEIGWLIVPRGLHGASTTEWLDTRLDGGMPGEPIPWLAPPAYTVTARGLAFWCDAPSIRAHADVLRDVAQILRHTLDRHGIRRESRPPRYNRQWLQFHATRLDAAAIPALSVMGVLRILDRISATLDIGQRGGRRPAYLADYLEYGLYFLTVTHLHTPAAAATSES